MANKGRKFTRYLILLFILQLHSCSDEIKESNPRHYQNVVEIDADDLKCHCRDSKFEYSNETDIDGNRQGMWRIFGHMKPDLGYPDDQVIEEGKFRNEKKQGTWMMFNKNGTLHKISKYSCDTLHGETREYDYENEWILLTDYSRGKIITVDTLLF